VRGGPAQPPGLGPAVARFAEHGVSTRVYPGAVWAAGDAVGPHLTGTAGLPDPAEPMRISAIFDMASLTKILAVRAVAGTLWDTGQIRLDDTLAALIPRHTSGYPLGQVTVRQLLTHTAGVPLRASLQALYGTDLAAIRAGVLHENLHRQPGQAVEYTDRAALILGYLIEELTGTSLDIIACDRIWQPLDMTGTRFGPLPPAIARRCAPTELDPRTGQHLKGTAHDFSARLLGGVSGIAGVFSTLPDTITFLRYMLDPAASAEPSFSDAWITESLQPCTGSLEPARGLFWHPAPGTSPADDIYTHYGFTGTAIWISRKQQRWAVLLTNKLYYNRDRPPLTAVRDSFREAIFA
jgi:CubicO group peptidase (beta-lactamase class C family)